MDKPLSRRMANGRLGCAWQTVADSTSDNLMPVRDLISVIDFDWAPSEAEREYARKLAEECGLI